MKRLLLSSAVVLGMSATSWSDPGVMPNPGSESHPKDPFQPYDTGPGAAWTYNDLSPADRAVVDKNRDASQWGPVHAAFNTAVAEQAQRAAASSAASQLGVLDLALTGVIP